VQISVLIFIGVSTVQLILSSVKDLENWEGWLLIEYIVSIFFTAELILRFSVSANKKKFCLSVMNLIDLLAIVPFYVDLALTADSSSVQTLRILRIVRLARIFRLLKVGRYLGFLKVFKMTLLRSSEPLILLLLFVFLLSVIFGSIVATIEAGECVLSTDPCVRSDGSVSPYKNYLVGIYWAITTLTTVGYGDTFPVEGGGRFIANIAMITGILIFALPLAVIGSNFQKAYEEYRTEKKEEKNKKKGLEQNEAYNVISKSVLTKYQSVAEEMQTLFTNLEERVGKSPLLQDEIAKEILQSTLQSSKELFSSKLELMDTAIASLLTRAERTERMIALALKHSLNSSMSHISLGSTFPDAKTKTINQ
jgi:voltage-gated potassium channel Kch